MENPQYMLEELVVSNGKYLELPKVKKVWFPWYQKKTSRATATLELSKSGYNSIIKQLDKELEIPRLEDSEYKDKRLNGVQSAYVDENVGKSDEPSEHAKIKRLSPDGEEAKAKYIIKVEDCKYQTQEKGQKFIIIIMYEKYNKYYMWFSARPEYKMFSPEYGE